MRDLRTRTHPNIKLYAREGNLRTFFLGCDKHGILYFKTTSGTHPGLFWYEKVQLILFERIKQMKEQNPRTNNVKLVQVALAGDINIYCNCPAFLYWGWKYVSWRNTYGLEPELRAPKRNLKYVNSTLCKHMLSVLETLPFNADKVAREYEKWGFL